MAPTLTCVCVVCDQVNPPGATQCLKCTAPIPLTGPIYCVEDLELEIVRRTTNYPGQMAPGTLVMYLIGKTDPLFVPIEDEVILGRKEELALPKLVDLTPYNAGPLGVSRRHAAIHSTENGYTIEDLASTNGTWVNEKALDPVTPHRLTIGDSVRLGKLVIYMYFNPTTLPKTQRFE